MSGSRILLLLGQARHRVGLLDEARNFYQQVLDAEPDNVEALQFAGLTDLESDRVEDARRLLDRAVALAPGSDEALFYRGLVSEREEAYDDALRWYDQALAINPSHLRALRKSATLYQMRSDWVEAINALKRVLLLDPDDEEASIHLGVCYLGNSNYNAAASQLRQVIERDPKNLKALNLLSLTCFRSRNYQAAKQVLHQSLEIEPDDVNALFFLGASQAALGETGPAIETFTRTIELHPDSAIAFRERGAVYRGLLRLEEALADFEKAAELDPNFATAINDIGLTLLSLGRINEAVERFQNLLKQARDHILPLVYSNFLFASHYDVDRDVQTIKREHIGYEEMTRSCLERRGVLPRPAVATRHRDPDRPLRVGYVSADFGFHPVGYFVSSVIARHDPKQVLSVCYSNRDVEDRMTDWIKANSGMWRRIHDQDDADVLRRIEADQIDILVDLSGHTSGNRLPLFLCKPAPVQATWAAYVGTTGLSAIDYLISDRFQSPPEFDDDYVEAVERMPDGYICYEPPPFAPAVGPLPAAAAGRITFGSFNNPSKVNDAVIAVWARILEQVPDSRLVLRYRWFTAPHNRVRILGAFERAGIEAERIELAEGGDTARMLAGYGDVDIGLDTFPYSGGLTTCEALWMGVPVVTVPGRRFEGRHSLSHLTNAGFPEWVAADADDYIQIALDLARDRERLAHLRLSMRSRLAISRLCESPRFAQNLDRAFRRMWQSWCSRSVSP